MEKNKFGNCNIVSKNLTSHSRLSTGSFQFKSIIMDTS